MYFYLSYRKSMIFATAERKIDLNIASTGTARNSGPHVNSSL